MIFSQRNPITLLEKGYVDLHGLHGSEAELCIQELLLAFSSVRKLFLHCSGTNKQYYSQQLLELPIGLRPNHKLLNVVTNTANAILAVGKVTILTGSGHHSIGVAVKGRVARVLDRICSLVLRLGYEYSECKDSNGFVGAISVSLI